MTPRLAPKFHGERDILYLHLGADWLADEYRRAAEAIDADMTAGSLR